MDQQNTRPDPSKVISPKVIASAIGAVSAAALSAALGVLTPDLFEFLGPWSGVAFAAVTGGGAVAAAYLKGDPLRG